MSPFFHNSGLNWIPGANGFPSFSFSPQMFSFFCSFFWLPLTFFPVSTSPKLWSPSACREVIRISRLLQTCLHITSHTTKNGLEWFWKCFIFWADLKNMLSSVMCLKQLENLLVCHLMYKNVHWFSWKPYCWRKWMAHLGLRIILLVHLTLLHPSGTEGAELAMHPCHTVLHYYNTRFKS